LKRSGFIPLFILAITSTSFAGEQTTGLLKLTFTERSPLSRLDQLSNRTGDGFERLTPSEVALAEYDLAKESFDVFVPPDYQPDVPHGLLVWVGVTEYSPEWLDVLPRHRMIFITAAGGVKFPKGLSLDAVHNMKKRYNIDESRIYVFGFSASGAFGVEMLRNFPDVFHGGMFFMGGYFYVTREVEKGEHRGSNNGVLEGGVREPTVLTSYRDRSKGPLDQIKKDVKILLLRGEGDPTGWTPEESKADCQALVLDGFVHVSYMELPKWGHVHPNADWFDKALTTLETTTQPLPTTQPTKDPHPKPGQLLQARRLLATALFVAENFDKEQPQYRTERARKRVEDQARGYLKQVIDEFPTTPSAATARQLLAKLNITTSQPATRPYATARPREGDRQ